MLIKLVQLNIWVGELLDNSIAWLKEQDPDILCLQEVYNETNESLPEKFRLLSKVQKELGMPFVNFAPAMEYVTSEGKFVQGNAILSKFPIASFKAHFFDIPFKEFKKTDNPEYTPRNVQEVQIDLRGKVLNVFNLHGIWGKHGDDTERRLSMVEKILMLMKDKTPSVLCGDFNVNERVLLNPDSFETEGYKWKKTQAIQNLEKHLVNVFREERTSSFNLLHKATNTGYAFAVVDMVFISPDLKVVSHACPNVNVSDHLPTVVILEI